MPRSSGLFPIVFTAILCRFDIVVSFSSLHWHSDQMAIIKKVYQALKKDGQFLFTIPLRASPEILATFRELMNKDEWKEYYPNYSHPRKKFTADEYATLLTEAGFKSLDIKVQNREFLFENKRSLIDSLKTHSVIDSLPEDKVENFLTNFTNSYAEQFTRPDGQIPFMHIELLVKASK